MRWGLVLGPLICMGVKGVTLACNPNTAPLSSPLLSHGILCRTSASVHPQAVPDPGTDGGAEAEALRVPAAAPEGAAHALDQESTQVHQCWVMPVQYCWGTSTVANTVGGATLQGLTPLSVLHCVPSHWAPSQRARECRIIASLLCLLWICGSGMNMSYQEEEKGGRGSRILREQEVLFTTAQHLLGSPAWYTAPEHQ